MFLRIGPGLDNLTKHVTLSCAALLVQVLADDRVNQYFAGTDMAKQRAHQVSKCN